MALCAALKLFESVSFPGRYSQNQEVFFGGSCATVDNSNIEEEQVRKAETLCNVLGFDRVLQRSEACSVDFSSHLGIFALPTHVIAC